MEKLLPNLANIKIYWDDMPHNYSREAKNTIRNAFATKYGVDKNKINVIYRPVKYNDNGDAIEITGANIENIMNVTYQRQLMKDWLLKEKREVDFDRVIKLDDKVNAELSIDPDENRHTSWSAKWIMINNFLSYGESNYLSFDKAKGLTIVNSIPSNQGGKTTLIIDALKFLLHGSTTKTEKNEQIFNTYSNKNEVLVRGLIEISGEEVIIEKKLSRSAKKGGGWTITNKVSYYTILPDGTEKKHEEEDATVTSAKIRKAVGSSDDFELLVLATEQNLEDLINFKPTESGKTLTRLIGLEIIEKKEEAARLLYNTFTKKKVSNTYDRLTLLDEIAKHKEIIEAIRVSLETLRVKLQDSKNEIATLNDKNDSLLNSKEKVENDVNSMNPSKLEEDIKEISKNGVELKGKFDGVVKMIEEIGEVNFDEDGYQAAVRELNEYNTKVAVLESKRVDIMKTIQQLKDGGICQACNRTLDNVDNTAHIKLHETNLKANEDSLKDVKVKMDEVHMSISAFDVFKEQSETKNKLELNRDRLDIEIGGLRNSIVAKKNDFKKYKLNLKAIEHNRNVDMEVSMVKTQISVAEFTKDEIMNKISKFTTEQPLHEEAVITKTALSEKIIQEDEVDYIFKTYIDLVGRKGISKLVLRSVIPIINSELERILDGVCDFNVEVNMDDKNEVSFLLEKDDVTKLLKSGSGLEKTVACLALRCVLGRLSILPMPNFISFDEVMGKVANENLEKLRPLFEKMKDMYEIVFLITHNDIAKDWGDNILTVEKKENISKISFK